MNTKITQRIEKLREKGLRAVNRISAERALLITQFYRTAEPYRVSVPVARAMAFDYILSHKKIYIDDGELIVGERGPEPKAVPTYPEVSLHSLEDLRILNTRPKVSFRVDEDTFAAYRDVIIPFWKGRSNRERIMGLMDEDWLRSYEAGIFTEFQEQRAPGHTVGGSKIFNRGMLDLIEDIHRVQLKLDLYEDYLAFEKNEELKAMEIAARALIHFANRHADLLEELSKQEEDLQRKSELKELAQISRRVPAFAPSTFHEALQHYWYIHLGVITEVNPWDSFNPGRLDQHLFPFWQKDRNEGRLSDEKACELLEAFWIKFNNHPAPPKVGVTGQESNTYTDFALINVGGVKVDGSDAVNPLSYLILDVVEEMRILQPSSMVQISRKNPDQLLHRAFQIIQTGFGQPSLFNTDAIIAELVRQGKSIEDARNGGASGCVEAGAFGTEAYWLTGYLNLPKILEITLNNGFDPRTKVQLGPNTGTAESFENYNQLLNAFQTQLNHFIQIKIKGNNIIEKLFAHYLPVPFLSLIIDDCIENGMDYNAGGARYNTSYIQGVGIGSLTDSLTAIKYHVFDKKTLSMNNLIKVLENDFEDDLSLRHLLVYQTPKYGNDDDYADIEAQRVFEMFFEAVDGRPTARGGKFRINLLPTTSHIYFGSVIGALPDGRRAGQPLSEGISPVQGADHHGPTAVIRSCAKLDHLRTGGTLLNQKFTPSFFKNHEAIQKLTALVRTYFRLDGHHIQFNVVNAEILRDAQREPEKYRDLIVRVAGYSDYFNDLTPELQEEIIRRTEHETM